jgi:hypothetical protein
MLRSDRLSVKLKTPIKIINFISYITNALPVLLSLKNRYSPIHIVGRTFPTPSKQKSQHSGKKEQQEDKKCKPSYLKKKYSN